MYGSGVANEESSRNPGASILENGRHELCLRSQDPPPLEDGFM
jgi:hypothetical protein